MRLKVIFVDGHRPLLGPPQLSLKLLQGCSKENNIPSDKEWLMLLYCSYTCLQTMTPQGRHLSVDGELLSLFFSWWTSSDFLLLCLP